MKKAMINAKSNLPCRGRMRRIGTIKGSVTRARKRIKAMRSSIPNQEAMARTNMDRMINPIPKVTIQFTMGMGKPNMALLLHSAHFDNGKSQQFAAENLCHPHALEIGQRGHIFLYEFTQRTCRRQTSDGGRCRCRHPRAGMTGSHS